MTELPALGEQPTFPRSRDASRLVLEIAVWLLAFSLLLCVPTERSAGGTVDRARPAETR